MNNGRQGDSPQHSPTSPPHEAEIRFAFGRNWRSFLKALDDNRLETATASLRNMLDCSALTGLRFLDVGSGSGVFSLAARRLGASVVSFDIDADSVACTRALRERYYADDPHWEVLSGSALDDAFLARLGTFDVVYSWGVLHHTGEMWRALDLVCSTVRRTGGRLFIAIYNDQGAWSRRWARIKRRYCESAVWRATIIGTIIPFWVLRGLVADLFWRRNPIRRYTEYRSGRGMSVWHDWIDWLGGHPFEVAKPEDVVAFFRARGFTLDRMTTVGGSTGCNEFVFQCTGDCHSEDCPEFSA